MMEAFMRVLGSEDVPLHEIEGAPTNGPLATLSIPGFGCLMVGESADKDGTYRALLLRPNAQNKIGPGSERIPKEVTVADDGSLIIPMLHKGDRLDVVIWPDGKP